VLLSGGGKLGGVLLVLEPLVAGADGGLVEPFARLEAADVFEKSRLAWQTFWILARTSYIEGGCEA
jgi:hypothetical protein